MGNLTFDNPALSAIVAAEIERCGSLRAAQNEADLGFSVLSKLSSGRRPTPETLYALASWLGVKMPDWRKICEERGITIPPQ